MADKARVAVLISGRGSNLAALVKAAERADYPAEIVLVISNRPDAPGLDLARQHGIAVAPLDHRAHNSRAAFDAEMHSCLTEAGIELVVCAGFMRIMSAGFIDRWVGRMINIHPSLLPLYKGLNTHERALADGVRVHGCTVHYVVADLDAGPIIAQAAVPVCSGDTADVLASRVLRQEHILLPAALAAVASGTIRISDGKVVSEAIELPGQVIHSPGF